MGARTSAALPSGAMKRYRTSPSGSSARSATHGALGGLCGAVGGFGVLRWGFILAPGL